MTNKTKDTYFCYQRRILQSTGIPLFHRVVIVNVWYYEGKFFHEFIPVAGLVERTCDVWVKEVKVGQFPNLPPPSEDPLDHGWRYSDRETDVEFVCFGVNESGPTPLSEFEGGNVLVDAVTCTWPPAEDELKLQDVVKNLENRLLEKCGQKPEFTET